MKYIFLGVVLYLLHATFVEHPLISYGLIALFSGYLFDRGLFCALFACILLFKLRYRWEREGIVFAAKLALIVLCTGPYLAWSAPGGDGEYRLGDRQTLVRLPDQLRPATSGFMHCALKLANLFGVCITLHSICFLYAVS